MTEKEILNLIKNSKNILLITHVNPDGDTLGCASALKCVIKDNLNINCDILVQIKDNFNFPTTYNFLPHIKDAINLSQLKDGYDLIITLDTASIDRIIDKAHTLFEKCTNTIVIDHHKTNPGFGKINYIEGGISSTAEVMFNLFKKLDIKITSDMALGLYAGLLTDTGCFKYESTTTDSFQMASNLIKTGINISDIADKCYTNKPKNMILFQNYLVSSAKFILNDKIAYTLITKDIIEKFKAKDEYTEGICETLRSISAVEAAFVLKESDYGTKISIRTKEVNAIEIAQKFNGGGHKRAAGCTIKANINQAAEKLIEETKKILK